MTYHPKPLPYSAFTIQYSGTVDKIIIPIKISKAYNPQTEAELPFSDFKALLDTGATKSVITDNIAKTLGLVPVGVTTINHAGGTSKSPTYLVNLFLPNQVGFAGVLVSTFQDGVGDFESIIGMDILMSGDFSISNVDNKTSITFRIPGYKAHDFVAESIRIQFPDVKMYQPCPCGKKDNLNKPVKFRDCHGSLLKTK